MFISYSSPLIRTNPCCLNSLRKCGISFKIFAFEDLDWGGPFWGLWVTVGEKCSPRDGVELISCWPESGQSWNKGYEQRTHAKDINTSDTFSLVSFELCCHAFCWTFIFPKYQNGHSRSILRPDFWKNVSATVTGGSSVPGRRLTTVLKII